MEFLFNFLPNDWAIYINAGLSALGGLVLAASAITPLTSTPKDDEALAKAKDFLHRFSFVKPKTK